MDNNVRRVFKEFVYSCIIYSPYRCVHPSYLFKCVPFGTEVGVEGEERTGKPCLHESDERLADRCNRAKTSGRSENLLNASHHAMQLYLVNDERRLPRLEPTPKELPDRRNFRSRQLIVGELFHRKIVSRWMGDSRNGNGKAAERKRNGGWKLDFACRVAGRTNGTVYIPCMNVTEMVRKTSD